MTLQQRHRLIRLGKPLGTAIKDPITIVTPAKQECKLACQHRPTLDLQAFERRHELHGPQHAIIGRLAYPARWHADGAKLLE